jgi:FixJ family two-component response regulator
MSDTSELLVVFWQTVKEYISAKDRQIAADHIINELVELGITDNDLLQLAVDGTMRAAIAEHLDIEESDEDSDDDE